MCLLLGQNPSGERHPRSDFVAGQLATRVSPCPGQHRPGRDAGWDRPAPGRTVGSAPPAGPWLQHGVGWAREADASGGNGSHPACPAGWARCVAPSRAQCGHRGHLPAAPAVVLRPRPARGVQGQRLAEAVPGSPSWPFLQALRWRRCPLPNLRCWASLCSLPNATALLRALRRPCRAVFSAPALRLWPWAPAFLPAAGKEAAHRRRYPTEALFSRLCQKVIRAMQGVLSKGENEPAESRRVSGASGALGPNRYGEGQRFSESGCVQEWGN